MLVELALVAAWRSWSQLAWRRAGSAAATVAETTAIADGGGRWTPTRRCVGDDDRETTTPIACRPNRRHRDATPSPTSFGTVSDAERIRKSATDTIKKHDKNGNGILEGDELNDLGMSRRCR